MKQQKLKPRLLLFPAIILGGQHHGMTLETGDDFKDCYDCQEIEFGESAYRLVSGKNKLYMIWLGVRKANFRDSKP